MKLSTPRWWYLRGQRGAPFTRTVLRPVSWLWAWVTARRIARTVPGDPGVPVVCVGNLTVGGTGKTPIVRELLERLPGAHGLSRGHGGRIKTPMKVDPSHHTADDVGDEPLMLAKDYPVWISRDRCLGAEVAAAAGATAVVMDDGHQNPSVRKTLSLVVVDGETRHGEWPFGDGSVFPSGPMREPLKAGLARADAVVILMPAGLAEPEAELTDLFKGKPVLLARLEPAAPPPAGPQIGFAGVGKPWKVERALRESGCDLADFAAFPDHHVYSEQELRRLEGLAKRHGAGLVTTEKDWVRLPAAWREKIAAWPVRARFLDEPALEALLTPLRP